MYLFTFALLGFFAFDDVFLKRKKYYLAFACIAIGWLIFHDGFRWGVGTDWNAYYNYFINTTGNNEEGFEPGYVFITRAVQLFTDNYTVFLILHAIIVYSLISRSIFKYSAFPFFSIFFFYCMMLNYLGMNRQYISFAICIFSYKYIFEKKPVQFALCILTACLFHTSSLMFGLAYFLNKEFSKKYLLWIIGTAFIISITGLLNRLPLNLFFLVSSSVGDKVTFYSENQVAQASLISTIISLTKRSVWIIIALVYKDVVKNKDQYFNFFFNLYFVSAVIYIVFNNTILQMVVARGLLYFNVSEIFLVPYLLTVFKNGKTRILLFLLIVINGWLLINKGFNFYKEDLGVDIFNPYNSVLIDNTYDAMQQ